MVQTATPSVNSTLMVLKSVFMLLKPPLSSMFGYSLLVIRIISLQVLFVHFVAGYILMQK
jgi:hypothetical protein